MIKKSINNQDDADLFEMLRVIWKGKYKVALAIIISVLSIFFYQNAKKNPIITFLAKTEVLPVSTLESSKYDFLNNFIYEYFGNKKNISNLMSFSGETSHVNFLISKDILLTHYYEAIQDMTFFEEAIRKHNLVDASKYNDEKKYNEAIVNLASSIKISLINGSKDKNKIGIEDYISLEFRYTDENKWKTVLKEVNTSVNNFIKLKLQNQYTLFIKDEEQSAKYKLEDLSVKINNLREDYERNISNRTAYLQEQSAIAKQLGIEKNTIEVQTFGTQNTLLSNIKTDSPFYLRGFKAIDKEIELMQLRKDKDAFIPRLVLLEKEKREIEQNPTIQRLNKIFKETPLSEENEFIAASLKASKTTYKYKKNKDNMLMVPMAIAIGLIIGVFYVLISDTFLSRQSIK